MHDVDVVIDALASGVWHFSEGEIASTEQQPGNTLVIRFHDGSEFTVTVEQTKESHGSA